MSLHQIRDAVMYVSKFLAINLELDPPDCSGLGEDPEDVSKTFQPIPSCLVLTISAF